MPTAYILAGLIALCPVFCGVVDGAIGAHSHAEEHGPAVPSQCPESADNCICHGAVFPAADGKVLSADAGGLGGSLDLCWHNSTPHHVAHLTWDGAPTGLAALGDSLTVRSYLQNFRC
jgi:hypothetical protein